MDNVYGESFCSVLERFHCEHPGLSRRRVPTPREVTTIYFL